MPTNLAGASIPSAIFKSHHAIGITARAKIDWRDVRLNVAGELLFAHVEKLRGHRTPQEKRPTGQGQGMA